MSGPAQGGWLCTNDYYCQDPTRFNSIAEFELTVRDCFPNECDGFELREGTDANGRTVVRDEVGRVVLVWVGANW